MTETICEQCGAYPARWLAGGQDVCAFCRECYIGTFDEGRDVGKEELARMLRYFDMWEAAELMAYTAGHPRLFTHNRPAPSITRAEVQE